MSHSRALGQPRSNTGIRTPLPSRNMVDESQLTYKPSSLPWVKLLFNPTDPNFVEGQSVQIYDIVPMYRTPTAEPRPSTVPPSDVDTLYRYRRRDISLKYRIATMEKRICHVDLSPTPPVIGVPTQSGNRVYTTGKRNVYYLKIGVKAYLDNMSFDVPMHTGVTLLGPTSRSGSTVRTMSNVNSLYYDVQVYVEEQSWEYTNGVQGCYARDLSALTPAKQSEITQRRLSRPRCIDATRVPFELRGGAADSYRTIKKAE